MKPIRTCFLVLALCLAGMLVSPVQAAETRIGFIDIKQAVAGTNEFKRLKEKFDADFAKEQKIIADQEVEVKSLFEELNKQGFVLSPELKKKKEDRFIAQKKSLERYVQDRNDEFGRREKEITLKITQRMLGVLSAIGKVRGFTLIVEKSTTFYHDPALDITDTAIAEYNKTHK